MPNMNQETGNRKQETAVLKQRIISELTASMKARDELKTSTLRMLKASIMNYEVSGTSKIEATDDAVVDLIKRGIKQRNEASEGFAKGGKKDMADKELAEIEILKAYLPEQMSEDALKEIVKQTVAELGAGLSDPSATLRASFGRVMGAVMAKVKGKADGALVSKAVKEILG